jgi:hypothetical protein
MSLQCIYFFLGDTKSKNNISDVILRNSKQNTVLPKLITNFPYIKFNVLLTVHLVLMSVK